MKLYVWRNGWVGAISMAYAESLEQAMELITKIANVGEDSLALEFFSNPPEIYESPKAFIFGADIYDIFET